MFIRRALGIFSVGNLLVIATVALILYMGSSFVQQIDAHLQRQEELHRLEQRLEAARDEEAMLQEHLPYVQSPEAAEAWARENGWAKSNEASVVVVAPTADASQVEGKDLEAGNSSGSRRGQWWDLFFGKH